MPGLQQFGLTLAGDAGTQAGLALGGQTAEPFQQLADRGFQRAEGQAGGDRTADVDLSITGIRAIGARHPDRQVDLIFGQELGRHMGEAGIAAGDLATGIEHGIHQ